MLWETIVRVRVDRNISMLEVYSRAFRPALSIKEAAMTTENRRTTPTRAASYLPHSEKGTEGMTRFKRQIWIIQQI